VTILVMLSGGVDSTAALVWALRETDEPVHAHHMHLINHEGRHEAEAEACRRIIAFCRQTWRDFDYSELTLDFSAMLWIPWDMLCVCFAAGQIVHKRPDIVRLVIGTCREEGHWRERWDHIYRMVEGAAWPARAPELLLPFLDRSKAEEMEYLPAEIRSLVWSCRQPVRSGSGLAPRDGSSYLPCGRCRACEMTGVDVAQSAPPSEESGT
jgi:7-cyano-7-deazaguanine synthase in queuosine biosynthesis